MPFIFAQYSEHNKELVYLVKEAHLRFPTLNESKQSQLLKALANVIEHSIIDSPCDDSIFTILIAITASYIQIHAAELKDLWKAVALWRHQQAMLLNYLFGFLCSFGEQVWLDTITLILGWIESDLLCNLLFTNLTPKNVTNRTELSLTNESYGIIEKLSKKFKRRLYEPAAISDAQSAFTLLLKSKIADRNFVIHFHAIMFAFDESTDPFVRSLALEYLEIDPEITFENYLRSLVNRIEGNDDFEKQLVKYSFDYGCRCTLKSTSTLAWRLFSEFAAGICTLGQIFPSVLDLLRNIGRSMRSLEKGQSVLEACLDAVCKIVCQEGLNSEDVQNLKTLITTMLNAPIEELYLKGYLLLQISNLKEEIDPILLLRGIFLIDQVEIGNKRVQFYYWLKQLLLMTEQEHLKPSEAIEQPNLITLYNRTSLRSQFWPKLVQHAVDTFGKSSLVDFIEAWIQKGECKSNFVCICQAASSVLPKDTLLSLIDRIVDLKEDSVEECTKRLIDEFDSRVEDEEQADTTTNPFLILSVDFDIFKETLTMIQ